MARILIAEDDRNTNRLLCAVTKRAGWEAVSCRDGAEALAALDKMPVDLIVTDVMMPRVDGFELCRRLREAGWDVPVLMLTAKAEQADKRNGFVIGADDYLTKPFDLQELVLRMRALLRRAGVSASRRANVNGVVFDADALTVTRAGVTQALPPKEFQLAMRLLASPGTTLTRAQLLEDVWGWDSESSEATVNVHVNRLRKRFEGWDEFEIQTVRGLGYRAVVAGR